MKNYSLFYFITLLVLVINPCILPAQDTIHTKRLKVLPVPAFGHSPETGNYFGAVALFTFSRLSDTSTRTSNAKIKFLYSERKQLILENYWNYFTKGEKWFTKGKLILSKYPDLYFGIGSNTSENNRLAFASNRLDFEGELLKKIGSKLFAGIRIGYINYQNVKAVNSLPAFNELVDGSTLSSGFTLLKDMRNNIITPITGVYLYSNLSYHFPNTNYLKYIVDLRYYKTWKNRITSASRFISIYNSGHPPFFDLAYLGGDQYVRGYYFGRFRDNNLGSFQTEIRTHIYARFGMAFFGGLSALYSNNEWQLLQNVKYNYGLGIRFLMDKKEKTNLRLDYAIGQSGNKGFYVAFGESF